MMDTQSKLCDAIVSARRNIVTNQTKLEESKILNDCSNSLHNTYTTYLNKINEYKLKKISGTPILLKNINGRLDSILNSLDEYKEEITSTKTKLVKKGIISCGALFPIIFYTFYNILKS